MSNHASWAAHHLPADTPVRHLIDPADDETPIRLLFGPADHLELAMPASLAARVIAALGEAGADLETAAGAGLT